LAQGSRINKIRIRNNMKIVAVKFIVSWNVYGKGEVAAFPPEVAENLIHKKIAILNTGGISDDAKNISSLVNDPAITGEKKDDQDPGEVKDDGSKEQKKTDDKEVKPKNDKSVKPKNTKNKK
jgi:hypothetical protein